MQPRHLFQYISLFKLRRFCHLLEIWQSRCYYKKIYTKNMLLIPTTFPVNIEPHHDLMLTSYDLCFGHHKLMMRVCVDWVEQTKKYLIVLPLFHVFIHKTTLDISNDLESHCNLDCLFYLSNSQCLFEKGPLENFGPFDHCMQPYPVYSQNQISL